MRDRAADPDAVLVDERCKPLTVGVVAVIGGIRAEEIDGTVPFVLMMNKSDLGEKWEVDADALAELEKRDWPAFKTSAKTGAGVEEAFRTLARRMLAG